MLDKTWRSLKNLFQSADHGTAGISTPDEENSEDVPSLSDEDFAFLFDQLLEGVSHGWQTARLERFFQQLGEQGRHGLWVEWMQRYYAPKVLASPTPDLDLAQRLILLAQQIQYLPKLMEVGAVSNALAQELQRRATSNPIVEYDGLDAEVSADGLQTQYVSLEELLTAMQADENLAGQIAEQLGTDETDPEALIRLLLERFQP